MSELWNNVKGPNVKIIGKQDTQNRVSLKRLADVAGFFFHIKKQ